MSSTSSSPSSSRNHRDSKKAKVTVSKSKNAPAWAHFIAGGIGGMLGAIITSPLEVVKTRLQASTNKASLMKRADFGWGTWNAIKTLAKEESLIGLYRGLTPHLVGVIPARAIGFFTYGNVKSYLATTHGLPPDGATSSIISGIVSGVTVVTATQPIWLIKTRMQLQSKTYGGIKYNNMFDAAIKMYKEEGLQVFSKGVTASYIGVSESTIQFVLYEYMKSIVQAYTKEKTLSAGQYLFVASSAKLAAAVITYPHEVIRTRLREANSPWTGVFRAFVTILMTEGARTLYGGMAAHLIRVVPNAAIMFLTYEKLTSFFALFSRGPNQQPSGPPAALARRKLQQKSQSL